MADELNTQLSEQDYLKTAARQVSQAAAQGPVPVDPDVAEAMGAFEEDALGLEDALDSALGEEGQSDEQ